MTSKQNHEPLEKKRKHVTLQESLDGVRAVDDREDCHRLVECL